MRAKSPHLVKLTGVDPLGVVLPLKIVSLFLSPFRVVGVDTNASLFSSWESLATIVCAPWDSPPPTDRSGRQVIYIANESTITAPTSDLKHLNYLKNYKHNNPET